MPALTQQQLDASQELATAAIASLKTDRGIHPGTVVAATARMAGTYLFRSFRLHLPGVRPGQAVLSEKANEALPTLFETTGRLLAQMGIPPDASRAEEPVGPKYQPTLDFLETQKVLEQAFAPIRTRCGFDDEQAAYAAAAATALLIRHCMKALDPNVAFGIAALGFVEGTKTAPDPVVRTDDSE